MCLQNKLAFKNINIQPVEAAWLTAGTSLDVLRLDEIHPIVSGNKWFKLKYYLDDAAQKGFTEITTFGGAYSNHIVAAAFACREQGFACNGIIRGEKPATPGETLKNAASYNMKLVFLSRDEFKKQRQSTVTNGNTYVIDEGGYGILGAKGAAEILQFAPEVQNYTHIISATGTGTMLAGLINASSPHQHVKGISVLKNNFSIEDEVKALVLNDVPHGSYNIVHDFHFGGYAKHPAELLEFMREAWSNYSLPTDIVYTAKTLYAVKEMIVNHTLPTGARILMIHSGGLQGNTSLKPGVLPF